MKKRKILHSILLCYNIQWQLHASLCMIQSSNYIHMYTHHWHVGIIPTQKVYCLICRYYWVEKCWIRIARLQERLRTLAFTSLKAFQCTCIMGMLAPSLYTKFTDSLIYCTPVYYFNSEKTKECKIRCWRDAKQEEWHARIPIFHRYCHTYILFLWLCYHYLLTVTKMSTPLHKQIHNSYCNCYNWNILFLKYIHVGLSLYLFVACNHQQLNIKLHSSLLDYSAESPMSSIWRFVKKQKMYMCWNSNISESR